jgi:hypothetical protein
MKKNKKSPLQSIEKSDNIVEGSSCFSILFKHNVDCQRQSCSNWINHSDGNNCVMIAAKNGPHTLQEIGKIYGLTRMRICQIEKNIYEKIKNSCDL